MELFGIRITLARVLIFAVVVIVVMAVPVLRSIVWLLLPLGSGYDDIIEGAALAVIVIAIFIELWSKRYPNNPYNRKRKNYQNEKF